MTSLEEETKVLEQIFGREIKIKDLRLGDLAYLKDALDLDDILGVDPNLVIIAINEGCKWRDKLVETAVKVIYPKEAIYLDYLARLNEIHKDLSYSELRPIN